MRTVLLILAVFNFTYFPAVNPTEDTLVKKSNSSNMFFENSENMFCRNVVGIFNPRTQCNENFILDQSIYNYKVDTLPQVKFWRDIMNLHQDSAIISFAHSRERVAKISLNEWNCKTEEEKKCYRDSVKVARYQDTNARVLLTTGKKFFYDFENASLNFDRGINCFIANNVDPWYAQAILLIESPNKLQKSNVGAYGPFQLMKDVARMYGLKVNKQIDERANFERSAYAASSLIKNICIPRAHKMLDSLQIKNYSENELWFKLLVMHVYHAGAYNVQKAVFAINPTEGNMDLIYKLWQTQTARFKSASQNYSQLVLAAMLEVNARNNALLSIAEN